MIRSSPSVVLLRTRIYRTIRLIFEVFRLYMQVTQPKMTYSCTECWETAPPFLFKNTPQQLAHARVFSTLTAGVHMVAAKS